MKMKLAVLALASTFASLAAQAACPMIEGSYSYKCTVTRDSDADLGAFLETSGQLVVEQRGCDLYRFIETAKGEDNVLDLNEVDGRHTEFSTKIKKSNEKKLRVRISRMPDDSPIDVLVSAITAQTYVTKATIRTTRKGFVLKGKEKSKFLGIFTDNHSKFSCKFERI
jgi:hypothetical protein